MPTTRWFFNTRKGVVTVDGNPSHHPDWVRYDRTYHTDGRVQREYAIIEFHGQECHGTKMMHTQSDKIECNRNCETATLPTCKCQCDGKNHGIAYKEDNKGEDND